MSFYRPPGVYPELLPTAGLVSLWRGARIPVIVGRGQYTIAAMEPVVHQELHGTDMLSEAATSITRVGTYPGQSKYAELTDYVVTGTLASPSANISWSPANNEPSVGSTYFVTYMKLVSSDQYSFHVYTDENELVRVHGEENTTNLVSVGGVVALRQGCPAVGIVQIDLQHSQAYPSGGPSNPTPEDYYYAFTQALSVLEQLDPSQCRIVVPMTVQEDILTDYLSHVDEMSLTYNRRWRTIIRGRAASSSLGNSTVRDAFVASSSGYASHESARRMTVVSPGEVFRVVRNSVTGRMERTLFDGCVLAAAAAGKICAHFNPAMPITNKTLASIQIGRVFSNADMNMMAGSGACVFYYKGANLKCRHGLTCDPTNANTQEISVVEIEDWIKVQSIYVLENRYVGSLFSEEIAASIRASVIAFWNQLVNDQVIYEVDSGSVSVTQDPNDPRICNVFGRVKPMYPLNWIDVRFRFYAGGEPAAI